MRSLIFVCAAELPSDGVFGRDIPVDHYRRHLGGTRGDLYYDARGGLKPNAFTALAGSIADGHNLYLHLPTHYPNGDPDHLRLLDYGTAIQRCRAHFNARLRRLIKSGKEISTARETASFTRQEKLIEGFYQRHPFVLLGARGRGKSYALAQKIHHLIATGQHPVLIVSAFQENRSEINKLIKGLEQYLYFMPPDAACCKKPTAVHLIIDEAAALPPAQLLQLTRAYPCYTLATTTEGYEGSANTFRTTTLARLNLPAQSIQTLATGRRFSANDPLEQFIAHLFPDIKNETPKKDQAINLKTLQIRAMTPDALAADEALLTSIWQLLRNAHYRTRPEDLKRLLDLPDQILLTATAGVDLLGVAHLILETPLPDALTDTIISGKRRPRGRLLMQQLLLHTHNPDWATRTIYRIQRIAVAEHARRQGIATKLIVYAKNTFPGPIGTSFGYTITSAAFWQAQGFTEIRRAPYKRSRQNGPGSLWLFQS